MTAQLDIRVDTTAADAAADLGKLASSVDKVGAASSKAAADLQQAGSRVDAVAGAADGMASKTERATGALGAMAGGFEAMGLENVSTAMMATATATDFVSGASDALNLVLDTGAVKTAALAVKNGVLAASTNVLKIAQAGLNAVMRANPIGIVITVLALLVGALVTAYKNSETFRRICDAGFKAVAEAGRWMWNNVLQPVFSFLLGAIGRLLVTWGQMLQTLAKVPGFGWADGAGRAMEGAGRKAGELAGAINRIPKNAEVRVSTPGVDEATRKANQMAAAFTRAATAYVNSIGLGRLVGGSNNSRVRGRPFTAPAAGGPTEVINNTTNNVNITVQGAIDRVGTARQLVELLRQYGVIVNGSFV